MICPPCQRASKKPGKHRAHPECLGQMVGSSAVISCVCECRRLPSWWQPPRMDIGFCEDTPKQSEQL